MRSQVPEGVLDFGAGADPAPVHPDQVQQPDVVQPVAVLLDSSCKDGDPFFVDDVEGMIFTRARPFLIGAEDFPFFELYI